MSLLSRSRRWIRRLFPHEPPKRPDLVSVAEIRRWRQSLRSCCISPDIEVRGRRDALSRMELLSHASIDRSCIFWIADEDGAEPRISLGARSYVGPFCFLASYQPLIIGDDSLVGAYCYLTTGNHRRSQSDVPVHAQGYEGSPIRIGNNVWLGSHVVVLPGVTIGDNAVVGAGAVVTRSIPSGECWAGVPARPLPASS
ncbi:MAG: acyltransferase [Verrucomicrobiales bacterium]